MTSTTRSNASVRIAATLLVGLAATSFAPGCDQASQPGSVDMGGKEGREKITPGVLPTDTPAKPKAGVPQGRSIKERPAG